MSSGVTVECKSTKYRPMSILSNFNTPFTHIFYVLQMEHLYYKAIQLSCSTGLVTPVYLF